ncbi:MAG: AMP-binding protein [Alphaproteobacteria bacterium]|nr:AMP-binding protein [Alphaproteobacteria bacterium]
MALFGHSMGALIAFELTRRLTRAGRVGPVALFVWVTPRRIWRQSGTVACMPSTMRRWCASCAPGRNPPDPLDPALLQRILPPLRADLEICETYALEDGARSTSRSCLCGRDRRDRTRRGGIGHGRAYARGVPLHRLPGGHFFFLESARDAFLQRLASDLRLVCSTLLAERAARAERFRRSAGTGACSRRRLKPGASASQPEDDPMDHHESLQRDTTCPARCMRMSRTMCGSLPDAPAIRDGALSLSYRELDAWAATATALVDLGVRPGDRVALVLERSAVAVCAMLAAMKTGAVYVPVDLAYPAERIRFMLDDSRCAAILTDGSRPSTPPACRC